MSREYRLHKLLKSPHIWRPGGSSPVARHNIPSGFAVLDQWLGGGWPVGVLNELLLSDAGIGELALLLPALRQLGQDQGFERNLRRNPGQDNSAAAVAPLLQQAGGVAWVAPPYIPYAPALAQHGLDVTRMLVVHPGTRADALWVMEEVLRSSVCAAVLGWFAAVNDRSMRRLQLAAESGGCWAVIFRHARFIKHVSPAPLRIHIKPEAGVVRLHILRNRYGRVGSLSLPC